MSAKEVWLTAAAILMLGPFWVFCLLLSGEMPSEPLWLAGCIGLVGAWFCGLMIMD